jgi:hypothetical protein
MSRSIYEPEIFRILSTNAIRSNQKLLTYKIYEHVGRGVLIAITMKKGRVAR